MKTEAADWLLLPETREAREKMREFAGWSDESLNVSELRETNP